MTMFQDNHGMIMARSCHGGHVFPTRVVSSMSLKFLRWPFESKMMIKTAKIVIVIIIKLSIGSEETKEITIWIHYTSHYIHHKEKFTSEIKWKYLFYLYKNNFVISIFPAGEKYSVRISINTGQHWVIHRTTKFMRNDNFKESVIFPQFSFVSKLFLGSWNAKLTELKFTWIS